ncbi:MAG: hypothetical protein JNM89_07620 [Hyphomicrobiaceae bacterium]|nr:hypothetical protein [Hyphomicrobiaceae bacterium]
MSNDVESNDGERYFSRNAPAARSARVWTLLASIAAIAGVAAHVYGLTDGKRVAEALGGLAPATANATGSKGAAAGADDAVAALRKITDYEAARWHPLHFKPAIATATNEQCLTCHQEVLKTTVSAKSPAGVEAQNSIAWYQTLDTYAGRQETFHSRHLTTPFARQTMNLSCNFCHQGHDPREEAPGSSATAAPQGKEAGFTLRKVVDPSSTCLLCHGSFPAENMGLAGTWHENREALETDEAPNGCLSCHAEQFRTVRHRVNYLNSDAIEALAKAGSSDTCFGCHGGRSWFRISYPYPRHPWPGMDASEVPDWAKGRSAESRPEHQIKK